MKENKYDNEQFFLKYKEMTRSKDGLKGAGEWSELQKILPDFTKKRVLDLGCGYGWHCKYAVDNGASYVLGTDISHKMLEAAKKMNSDINIEYQCIAMEDLNLPPESFDIILSSLAFHYVKDFESIITNISKWIKKDGEFIFSVEHPVFTSYGSQDWYYDENGKILHFPVDNYYYEGKRDAIFLGEKVIKYHRTITTYLNTLLENGFVFQHIIEPQPPKEMLNIEGMKDEMRRPMMLLISVKKK
ncbi:class I SAM-dependent methyltransferase [Thomasclavelia sp.]